MSIEFDAVHHSYPVGGVGFRNDYTARGRLLVQRLTVDSEGQIHVMLHQILAGEGHIIFVDSIKPQTADVLL